MPQASEAAATFVRALAALILREGEASVRAREAREALDEVFAAQKSLVLDVQFTGFTQKGQLVGGVDPVVLRATGHLITLRLNRIGFTPDASAADLEALGSIVAKSAGELGQEGGAIGALQQARPHGLYASTAAGDVYKPPARAAGLGAGPGASVDAAPPAAEPAASPEAAPSTEPAPSADAPPPAAAPVADATPPASAPAAAPVGAMPWDEAVESTELAEFEFVDDPDEVFGAPAPAAEAGQAHGPSSSARAGEPAGREEPGASDMYHFFRTADHAQEQVEALPRLLHEASTVTRFDELAEQAARTALTLLRNDSAQAVELLDALVREAERPDRTRFFRESALQALRRAGTTDTLHRLLDLLPLGGTERERILRFFVFLGADALLMLEGLLYRAPEPDLRLHLFRTLVSVQGTADRLIAHAVQDPSPVRTRTLLELAAQSGMDPEVARRWAAEAAGHRETAVRVEAARAAAGLGGRASMRVLVDLLNDPERLVRREAIAGLGTLGDPAAVPFLARLLADGDEELQVAAAQSLGRIGSGDALPPLLTAVQKRGGLLSLKKATRGRLAALQAIARIDTPAAREAIAAVSQGRDEMAEEARRILATG